LGCVNIFDIRLIELNLHNITIFLAHITGCIGCKGDFYFTALFT
jgi:hypothetical protein